MHPCYGFCPKTTDLLVCLLSLNMSEYVMEEMDLSELEREKEKLRRCEARLSEMRENAFALAARVDTSR